MADKIIFSYIDEIGKRLAEPGLYGAASLMVGAGFSKNAICLGDKKDAPPDWDQLSQAMYEELYPFDKNNQEKRIKECSGKNVLTLAQKYEVTFDRQSLDNLIERSIADKNYVPGDLHRSLLELNWNDVFTTNYDTLLERAIEQAATKKSYKIVYSQNDLPGSVRPRLIKLHGSFEHSDHYIITEEDYRTYPDKYAPFVNTVQQSMLETRLCLIGFSGSDPNFLNWLGWLRDNMGDNCPAIYLCGVFDDLGTAERKMLEQRHITIVDLSVLIDDNDKNKHYNALKKFICLLEKKSKKKNETILVEKPYAHHREPNDKVDLENYAKTMSGIINHLTKKLNDYICLPKEESDKISTYIQTQLEFVLHAKDFNEKCLIINSYCAILKKCNYPLYDHIANKLRMIVEDKRYENNIKVDIILYLLQMYRIDGMFDDYLQMKSIIDIVDFDTLKKKNEYWIECVKFYMCTLDINKTYECMEKIEIVSYDEQAFKKASLLNQLNKKQEAKEIITSAIAFISQQKFTENKMASLIGYANLVARASWTIFNSQELFSDSLYEHNKFNCRKIVIDSKDSIVEIIFDNQQPQNRRIPSFNPNSYTINYTIGSTNESKKTGASLEYLLLQDLLCIGVYRDHKNATKEAVQFADYTSESPLWRWFYILKINDKKIYNLFFTRERIYDTELLYVEAFFDEIINLLEECIGKTDTREKLFVNYKTLTDIASKLTVVLDEDRIIKLITILIQIDVVFEDQNEKKSIINDSLNIIQYSFNTRILNKCLEFIFDNKLLDYSFSSYFDGVECTAIEDITEQQIEFFLKSLKDELCAEDLQIRDNAVIKYKLLESQILDSKYKDVIVESLWKQVDEFGFPKNNTYLPIAWINDGAHNVDPKICDYLRKPQIDECYDSGIVRGNDNLVEGQIGGYYRVLLQMFQYNDAHMFTKEQICEIIEYFYNYVKNEKNIIHEEYNFFGENDKAKRRFIKINDTILLLCVYAKCSEIYDADVNNKLQTYMNQMEEIGVKTECIRMIITDIDAKNIFAYFEEKILYCDEKDFRSLFTMLYGMIQIIQNDTNVSIIDDMILQFIQIIPYFEISIGKKAVLETFAVIKRNTFLSEGNKKKVVSMLNRCFDIYKNAKEERRKDGLDGMYNVSIFAKGYYKFLKEANVEIGVEFEQLIQKFKECKLNEVKGNWIYVL